jgi:DNA-binding transcriptional ArsR family regulator
MPRRNGTGIALLADPTRRRIIQLLAIRPRRPSSLAADVGRSRPAISRQLRILREARLIREVPVRHDRRGVLFMIHPDNLGRIVAWLAGTEIGIADEALSRPRQQSPAGRLARELPAGSPAADSLATGRFLDPDAEQRT